MPAFSQSLIQACIKIKYHITKFYTAKMSTIFTNVQVLMTQLSSIAVAAPPSVRNKFGF